MWLKVIQQLPGCKELEFRSFESRVSGFVFSIVISFPVLCSAFIGGVVFSNLFASCPLQCNKEVNERVYVTFKPRKNGSRLRRFIASKVELFRSSYVWKYKCWTQVDTEGSAGLENDFLIYVFLGCCLSRMIFFLCLCMVVVERYTVTILFLELPIIAYL